jgi:mono/diheme cytochrome c family protein
MVADDVTDVPLAEQAAGTIALAHARDRFGCAECELRERRLAQPVDRTFGAVDEHVADDLRAVRDGELDVYALQVGAPYPEIRASSDPDVIERGRYLAVGPAHCTACHARPAEADTPEPHLSGGESFELPIGTIYVPNITPDVETGVGRYSDAELARVLRHGVDRRGRALLGFMPFADLSDEDLTAVISYIRSRPPIVHRVPASDYNLLGRVAKAFLIEPIGPSRPIRARVQPGVTVEYGEYLVNTVANCAGCHTRRSLRTGKAIGVALSGGFEMESHTVARQKFVTPNLTPHPKSGHLYAWSEDVFVARFRNAVATSSPMPWASYRKMTDDDLRAIFRYLRSVPPAETGQDL